MTRIKKLCSSVALLLCLPIVGSSRSRVAEDVVPRLEVDPGWPQTLPNNWIMGQPLGIHVDSHDHIWVVQNPSTLPEEVGAIQKPPIAECCFPAPPVLEFDVDGKVVQAWGDKYVWPGEDKNKHGIFVDHNFNVWIGTSDGFHVQKFTRDGRHLLTIGDPLKPGDSNDPDHLNGPAGLWVDPNANELYIGDGYRNRRVVVFNADTGKYVRHWGAYGRRPDDGVKAGPRNADSPPSSQFGNPHGVKGSRDGLIYVADRPNSRIQVFRPNGEFITERNVAPGTLASGGAFDVGLSPDPQQQFLYVADGTNNKVRILRRKDLVVLGEFGRGGRQAGQFIRVHNLAVDSKGNVYTAEALGRRVQKFALR
jgi:sugar lactone lactonase YvrE